MPLEGVDLLNAAIDDCPCRIVTDRASRSIAATRGRPILMAPTTLSSPRRQAAIRTPPDGYGDVVGDQGGEPLKFGLHIIPDRPLQRSIFFIISHCVFTCDNRLYYGFQK